MAISAAQNNTNFAISAAQNNINLRFAPVLNYNKYVAISAHARRLSNASYIRSICIIISIRRLAPIEYKKWRLVPYNKIMIVAICAHTMS